MTELSLRVYVITEEVAKFNRTHEDVAIAAIAGGADVIQFRDKDTSDDLFEKTAVKLLGLCRAHHVPLIINDRVHIAIQIGADGVHVGHEDYPPAGVRQRITPGMILGVSARNYEEAVSLENSGADYLGVGPIFDTPSKADASEPIGLSELHRICKSVRIPVVAIGGITLSNLPRIIEAGAAGAAVISAVTHATDMQEATSALKDRWRSLDPTHPKRWFGGNSE